MLKRYKNIDFDSKEMAQKAKTALHTKKCLYENYKDIYKQMLKLAGRYLHAGKAGILLELGSGGGFFKQICRKVITSDVSDVNGVDMVIDARELPFKDDSVSVIFAVHVLHHIPDVEKFFSEVDRCCKTGGGCVLVEPYWSPVGKFFYKYMHPEKYDDKAEEWSFESSGAMSGANQALSYILLKRDRKIFQEKYPNFSIVYDRPFNGLRYLATGGLWLKPYLPQFMFPLLTVLEKVFWPVMYIIGIHHIFVIRKEF